jgi:hypothetical protein
MNTSNLERHYANLTVKERASLMISAKMRGDESERKKLIASAECKHFLIRGEEEAAICEAWFSGHISFLLLNSEQRNAELTCRLVSAMSRAGNNTESESAEKLVAKMLEFQFLFLQQRQASLLAFQDWMKEHEFPIDIDMLEECNVDFSVGDYAEKTEIRDSASYELSAAELRKIYN